eukprot:SAG31_NODE_466_length_15291_cov_7.540066_8_plen_1560_part_00
MLYFDHLIHLTCQVLGVDHFQIWNEPTQQAGAWHGSDKQFIDDVYLPAAVEIRKLGGKVVFGGWPGSNPLTEFNGLLRYRDAWRLTDVIDTHYRPVEEWITLANWTAIQGGPTALWQTEVAPPVPPDSSDQWMGQPNRLPNKFLRALYWALTSGRWSRPDQYRFFWFATGHSANGRGWGNECLSVGTEGENVPTIHGAHLSTMSSVLNGSFGPAFTAFRTVPELPATIADGWTSNSTALGFRMADGTVVVALLLRRDAFIDGAVRITLDVAALPGQSLRWVRLIRAPVAVGVSHSNYSVHHPEPLFLSLVSASTIEVRAEDLTFGSVGCANCDGPRTRNWPGCSQIGPQCTNFGPAELAVAYAEFRSDWTSCDQYFIDYDGDGNCNNLKNIPHYTTSEECRSACLSHANCTAVNYNLTGGGCVLRGCKPGTPPHASSAHVVGLARYDVNCSRKSMPAVDNRPLLVVGIGTTTPTFPQSPVDPPAKWMDISLGDIRALIVVNVSEAQYGAVVAAVHWRRRDLIPGPELSAFSISCSNASMANETFISNAVRISSNRTTGVIAFEPACEAGDYFVYYLLQCSTSNGFATSSDTDPLHEVASLSWRARHGLDSAGITAGAWRGLPRAVRIQFENRTEFDGFTDMEITASDQEVDSLTGDNPPAMIVFGEDRSSPIRMTQFLPYRWIQRGLQNELSIGADRGEYVSFQIAVFASRANTPLGNVSYSMTALNGSAEFSLPRSTVNCVTLEGVDFRGQRFVKHDVGAEARTVLPIWCGVAVPTAAAAQLYTGVINISAIVNTSWRTSASVKLLVNVSNNTAAESGDGDLWRRSRIRWLDSTRAQDDDPAPPFTAFKVNNETLSVSMLGRSLWIGHEGLPTRISAWGEEVLADAMTMNAFTENGSAVLWDCSSVEWSKQAAGVLQWSVTCSEPLSWLQRVTNVILEADGYADVSVSFIAREAVTLSDVSLRVPFDGALGLSMGMSGARRGGARPASGLQWVWQSNFSCCPKSDHMLWVSSGKGGMRVKLKGDSLAWESPSFMTRRASDIPRSWGGDRHAGGCTLGATDKVIPLTCASGAVTLRPVEPLTFRFDLMITPFHQPNVSQHFTTRHYQLGYPASTLESPENNIASIKNKYGASVLNLHQGTEWNPWISYPFLPNVTIKMTEIAVAARSAGLHGLKIYHEIHELSTRSSDSELWALLSLGDEVLQPKFPLASWPGGASNLLGFQWLQEHLLQTTNKSNPNYANAFYQPLTDGNMDQSVLLQPISRMNNWWVESIQYLTTHPPWIDGLYLDGTAVDRWTMKRARKVLAKNNALAHIDFHCDNAQGETYSTVGNGSVALRYMTHFPYISSLWLGEGYWYGQGWQTVPEPNEPWTPEEWLVEVSGLPFGLFGEMLGGSQYENPYQAFVFGMHGRMPQPSLYELTGLNQADPRPLYAFAERYNLAGTEMCGWWHGDCAVRSQDAMVKATVFSDLSRRRSIVAIANFGAEATNATLLVEWDRLMLEPNAYIHAPAVYNFQPRREFQSINDAGNRLTVPTGVGSPHAGAIPSPPPGWILVFEERSTM